MTITSTSRSRHATRPPVVSGPTLDYPPAGFSRHLRCHRLQPVVSGPTPHNPPAGFSRRVAATMWHPMRSTERDYDYAHERGAWTGNALIGGGDTGDGQVGDTNRLRVTITSTSTITSRSRSGHRRSPGRGHESITSDDYEHDQHEQEQDQERTPEKPRSGTRIDYE
ncbi:MAG: hypothetical protein ACYC6N_21120 [Pirellulaceae bacterium]